MDEHKAYECLIIPLKPKPAQLVLPMPVFLKVKLALAQDPSNRIVEVNVSAVGPTRLIWTGKCVAEMDGDHREVVPEAPLRNKVNLDQLARRLGTSELQVRAMRILLNCGANQFFYDVEDGDLNGVSIGARMYALREERLRQQLVQQEVARSFLRTLNHLGNE